MSIKLYELAGAEEDRRFSPYCWRIRFALAHKRLDFEAVPCRFTEKDRIAFSGQEKVPVLIDGDEVVSDSWNIACHLERAYPDRPSLFGGEAGQALTRFYVDWTDRVLHNALIRLLATHIHAHVHEMDKAYFRRTREQRFGTTLEEFCSDRERSLKELNRVLEPLRGTLRHQPYLGGRDPLYADYVLAGAFMWARALSPTKLLEGDDPVAQWRDRLIQRLDEDSLRLRAYS